jgi:hypothetical protein
MAIETNPQTSFQLKFAFSWAVADNGALATYNDDEK